MPPANFKLVARNFYEKKLKPRISSVNEQVPRKYRTWNLNEKPQNAYYTYRQISPSLVTAYSVNDGKSYVPQM